MINAEIGSRENRILSRGHAERYIDKRNKQKIRSGFGLIRDRADLAVLILWLFAMAVGFYHIAGKKKRGFAYNENFFDYSNEWDQAQLEWQSNCLKYMCILGLAFMTIIILSNCIKKDEQKYQACVLFFFFLLIALCVNIYKSLMVGFKQSYGHYLDRELHIQDPMTKNVTVTYDDGTYMIEDDKVVGRRQEFPNHYLLQNVTGTAEPIEDYTGRLAITGLALGSLIFGLVIIFLMVLYYSLAWTIQSRNSRRADVDSIMNQGRLMNMMRNVPYSRFMLDGDRDCTICLNQFQDDDMVVQLKCNQYHIFHYECLEQYLNYESAHHAIIKQCPICRKPVEITELCTEQVMVIPLPPLPDQQYQQRMQQQQQIALQIEQQQIQNQQNSNNNNNQNGLQ